MLIDSNEYALKLRDELEIKENQFDELMRQETSDEQITEMTKNVSEREGLLCAMRILVDMMEKQK